MNYSTGDPVWWHTQPSSLSSLPTLLPTASVNVCLVSILCLPLSVPSCPVLRLTLSLSPHLPIFLAPHFAHLTPAPAPQTPLCASVVCSCFLFSFSCSLGFCLLFCFAVFSFSPPSKSVLHFPTLFPLFTTFYSFFFFILPSAASVHLSMSLLVCLSLLFCSFSKFPNPRILCPPDPGCPGLSLSPCGIVGTRDVRKVASEAWDGVT